MLYSMYFIAKVKGYVHESIYIVSVKINYIFDYCVFQISKNEVKNQLESEGYRGYITVAVPR